jgi:hypothetical protein
VDDEQVAEGQQQYLQTLKAAAEREAAEGWGPGAHRESWTSEFTSDDGWRFIGGRYVPPPQFLDSTWHAYATEGVTVDAEAGANYMAAQHPVPWSTYDRTGRDA